MSEHTQAFALRISKRGSTPCWYAWNTHLGHVNYMACLANAELYPTRDRAESKAESLRGDGLDVEIVEVVADVAMLRAALVEALDEWRTYDGNPAHHARIAELRKLVG